MVLLLVWLRCLATLMMTVCRGVCPCVCMLVGLCCVLMVLLLLLLLLRLTDWCVEFVRLRWTTTSFVFFGSLMCLLLLLLLPPAILLPLLSELALLVLIFSLFRTHTNSLPPFCLVCDDFAAAVVVLVVVVRRFANWKCRKKEGKIQYENKIQRWENKCNERIAKMYSAKQYCKFSDFVSF